MPKRYLFDPETLQYYEIVGGRRRALPIASVAKDTVRLAVGARAAMRALSVELAKGRISLQEWYDGMRREMKLSYYASVSVARGKEPSDPLRAAEIAFLLWLLTRQFDYLDDFLDDIESGMPLDGRFVARAGMYGMATKSVFENWRLWTARSNGWAEARRVLGFAEHCHDSNSRRGCEELASLGWMPIVQMTPLGEATCLTNCQCTIEYRTKSKLAQEVTRLAATPSSSGEVRDEHGRLLFKYDPVSNTVEIKHKGMMRPKTVDLNRYKSE